MTCQFIPSVLKSTKQFGFNFAYDDNPDISSATFLLSFWKKLKAYLFTNAFSDCLCGLESVDPASVSPDYEYWRLCTIKVIRIIIR